MRIRMQTEKLDPGRPRAKANDTYVGTNENLLSKKQWTKKPTNICLAWTTKTSKPTKETTKKPPTPTRKMPLYSRRLLSWETPHCWIPRAPESPGSGFPHSRTPGFPDIRIILRGLREVEIMRGVNKGGGQNMAENILCGPASLYM